MSGSFSSRTEVIWKAPLSMLQLTRGLVMTESLNMKAICLPVSPFFSFIVADLSADYIFSEIIGIQFKGNEILRRYDRLSGNAVRLSGQDMIPAIFPKLVLTNRKIRQERKQCQYSKQLSPHNVSLFSKLQF
jgi:hypothetical protein